MTRIKSFTGIGVLVALALLGLSESHATGSSMITQPFATDECVDCGGGEHHTLLGCPEEGNCIIPGDGHSTCTDAHGCTQGHGICFHGENDDDTEVAAAKPSMSDLEHARLAVQVGNMKVVRELADRFPAVLRLAPERGALQMLDCKGMW